jgi:hypothetical protein
MLGSTTTKKPADGTLYATDRVLGRIVRLKPGATEPDVWPTIAALVGIDGTAFAGERLYFNNVQKNLCSESTSSRTAAPAT